MLTSSHISAVMAASLMHGYGVREVVVSPGSRNTPLVVAASRRKGLKLLTVNDERTAGFIALGMAARTSRPVALVCTSGTALLNYAPAVAEAFYRHVPLLVFSSDRPCRWIDQDDGQTIRQPGALANIVAKTVDIPSKDGEADYGRYVNRLLNDALLTAVCIKRAPVHINMRFDEPLGEMSEVEPADVEARRIGYIDPVPVLSKKEVTELTRDLRGGKIAIAVGLNCPDARLNKALKRIGALDNVAVFHEAQSNVKGLRNSVDSVDATLGLLSEAELDEFCPDWLLSVGGQVMSKKFKQWIRTARKPVRHWYLTSLPQDSVVDCYRLLTQIVRADVPSFINTLCSVLQADKVAVTGYSEWWAAKSAERRERTRRFLRSCPWSDFAAVAEVVDRLGSEVNLQVSNGMSIRYVQFFDYANLHRIDCNRGCSGIDGSTSTAVGAAIDCNNPTVLLTGDNSFFYDLGGLAAGTVPPNFSVIVLNNGGGDIFRNIASTKDLDGRERYFTAPSDLDVGRVAETFGFRYHLADGVDSLRKSMDEIKKSAYGPRLVEIRTRGVDNAGVLRDYYNSLKIKKI